MSKPITVEDVKKLPMVQTFIEIGNEHLGAMGFTEHSYRHAGLVAKIAGNTLSRLGYPKRDCELAEIAGYMHDMGNVISRYNHGQSSAYMAIQALKDLGMAWEEIALVAAAVGNHEEQYGHPVNHIAAALILADKSDVHRSRVRNTDVVNFDIHDRVNYAAQHSFLRVDSEQRIITLELEIDTEISDVMEYFEIFLTRMIMCRRAADHLDSSFSLVINESRLL
ncbi:MAG: HD domain-containing protein [Firmicutes bacterium]|nr:HD domain-containing protein [Bacillota bacterium]